MSGMSLSATLRQDEDGEWAITETTAIVPARCGPHVPYEDLYLKAEWPRGGFIEAFEAGRAKVTYWCRNCGAGFYFGQAGIGACCHLPQRAHPTLTA